MGLARQKIIFSKVDSIQVVELELGCVINDPLGLIHWIILMLTS
jgi:hypothetical protein